MPIIVTAPKVLRPYRRVHINIYGRLMLVVNRDICQWFISYRVSHFPLQFLYVLLVFTCNVQNLHTDKEDIA